MKESKLFRRILIVALAVLLIIPIMGLSTFAAGTKQDEGLKDVINLKPSDFCLDASGKDSKLDEKLQDLENENTQKEINQSLKGNEYALRRLMIKLKSNEDVLPEALDNYGVEGAVKMPMLSGAFIVTFDTIEHTKKAAQFLKGWETVEYVEGDKAKKIEATDDSWRTSIELNNGSTGYTGPKGYFSWGTKYMGVPEYCNKLSDGKKENQINVAVCDTGMAANAFIDGTDVHTFFKSRHADLGLGYNFLADGKYVTNPGYNSKVKNYADDHKNYHGTCVASVIADLMQEAGGVNIWSLKIADAKGITNEYLESVAMQMACFNRANVINVSTSGVTSKIVQETIKAVEDKGVCVIYAAGNENKEIYIDEGGKGTGIVVGGIDTDFNAWGGNGKTYGTNSGECVDLVAPAQTYMCGGDGGIWMEGTSFSAPYVTALAGLLKKDNQNLTPYQIESLLKSSGDNLKGQKAVKTYGAGLPHLETTPSSNRYVTLDANGGKFPDGNIVKMLEVDTKTGKVKNDISLSYSQGVEKDACHVWEYWVTAEGKKVDATTTFNDNTTVYAKWEMAHDTVKHPEKKPTCTTPGNNAYLTCNKCNMYLSITGNGFKEMPLDTTEDYFKIEKKGHKPGKLIEGVDPTCTNGGQKAYRKCDNTGCNQLFDKDGNEVNEKDLVADALGHSPGNLIAKDNPTCETKGTKAHAKCKRCSQLLYENGEEVEKQSDLEIPALGHQRGAHYNRIEPTCTKAGKQEYWICNRCNMSLDENGNKYRYGVTIEATGHHPGELHNAVAATCTEDGNIAYRKCKDCNQCFNEAGDEVQNVVVEKLGHDFEFKLKVLSTCTTDGVLGHQICNRKCCKGLYYDFDAGKYALPIPYESLVSPAGHKLYTVEKVDADCKTGATGMKKHQECKKCGLLFTMEGEEVDREDLIINPEHPEHKNKQATAAKPATCTTAGNSAYWYCPDCKKYYSDENCTNEITKDSWVIAATKHENKQAIAAKPATCTTAGNSAYWYCPDCEKYYSDENCTNEITKNSWVIVATKHENKQAIAAKPATCTETGYDAYWYCSDCSKYYSDEACEKQIGNIDSYKKTKPANGHNYVKHPAVLATIDKAGTKAHYTCDNCKKLFTLDKYETTENNLETKSLKAVDTKQYEEVPYIENQGAAYINTGYALKNETHKNYIRVMMKFKPMVKSGAYRVFGSQNNGNGNIGTIVPWDNGNIGPAGKVMVGSQTTAIQTDVSKYNDGKTCKFDLTADNGKLSGTYLGTELKDKAYKGNLDQAEQYIFALHRRKAEVSKSRVYNCSIANEEKLVRDFVPVKKLSTGEYGLYDRVEGVFYGNASGSGEFTSNTCEITLNPGEVGANEGLAKAIEGNTQINIETAVGSGKGCTVDGYWTTANGNGVKILNTDGTFAADDVSDEDFEYVKNGKWVKTGRCTLYARGSKSPVLATVVSGTSKEEIEYYDLDKAIEAAKPGDTVKLCKDNESKYIPSESGKSINKGIIIDANGYDMGCVQPGNIPNGELLVIQNSADKDNVNAWIDDANGNGIIVVDQGKNFTLKSGADKSNKLKIYGGQHKIWVYEYGATEQTVSWVKESSECLRVTSEKITDYDKHGYKLNFVNGDTIETVNLTNFDEFKLPEKPIKDGKKFAGWAFAENSEVVFSAKNSGENIDFCTTLEKYYENADRKDTGEINLYAVWKDASSNETVNKGSIVKTSKDDGRQFIVLDFNDEDGTLKLMEKTNTKLKGRDKAVKTLDSSGKREVATYKGSTVDNYLNGDYYQGLPDVIKTAVVPEYVKQTTYVTSTGNISGYTYRTKYSGSKYANLTYQGYFEIGSRYCYAPSVQDLRDFYDKNDLQSNEQKEFFWKKDPDTNKWVTVDGVWLRDVNHSSAKYFLNSSKDYIYSNVDITQNERYVDAVFTVDACELKDELKIINDKDNNKSKTASICSINVANSEEDENVQISYIVGDGEGGYVITDNKLHEVDSSVYNQAEYIESTGKQYINTGVTPDNTTVWEQEMQYTNVSDSNQQGVATKGWTNRFEIGGHYQNKWVGAYGGYIKASVKADTNKHAWKLDAATKKLICDGKDLITGFTGNINQSQPIYLMARNVSGKVDTKTKCRLYSSKLTKGGQVVRDFVPVKEKSTGKYGLFDRVTGEFYGNAGTGSFTGFHDVDTSKYEEVSCIESTGKQYINTGVTPDNTTVWEQEMQYTNVSDSNQQGVATKGWTNRFEIGGHYQNKWVGAYGGYIKASVKADTNKHAWKLDAPTKKLICDGKDLITGFTGNINQSQPIYLMARNVSGKVDTKTKCRLYSSKLTKGGQVVRDFVPVKEKSTGKYGLFDRVTGEFYGNAGDGSFTGGSVK